MTATHNMDVQMRHAFTAVRSIVDNDPVAFFQIQILGHPGCHKQQVSQKFFILAIELLMNRERSTVGHLSSSP